MSKFQIYFFTFIILFLCCFVSKAENEEQHGTMVDDLKFDDYVYTVPQMDNIISNLPSSGGRGFPLTNNVSFDSHGASNVNFISFTTTNSDGTPITENPPAKSIYLGGDGNTLYFNGDPIGSGGGSGSISIIGAVGQDDDDVTHSNISKIKFDKSSGFTVNDNGPNEVEISLGSAWTELIPDFTNEIYPNLKPSGEEKLSIKAVSANQTGTYWDYENTNKNEKTFFIGINANGETVDDITVSSPIGKYANGDTIPQGTSINEVLTKMLTKKQALINPTLSIFPVNFSSGLIEYKSKIPSNAYIGLDWSQNDAGSYTNVIYKLDNVVKMESYHVLPYINDIKNDFDSLLSTKTTPFTASVTFQYKEGPVKDPDYPSERIPAGSLTKTFTMTPARYLYSGTSHIRYDITTPGEVIALSGKRLVTTGTRGSRSFQIECPVGTIQVDIAVPLFYVPKPNESSLPVSKVLFKSVSMPIESDITDQLVYREISSVPPENEENPEDVPMNKYGVCTLKSTEAFTGAAIVTVYY